MYKKLICKVLSIMLFLLFFSSQALFAAVSVDYNNSSSLIPSVEIHADSAILVETSRGQVLCGKDIHKRLHISTANKIMTAIIALEKSDINQKVTISKEAENSEGSVLNLEAGEKYTVEELIYALMLKSANDATNALAENIAGDTAKFVDMMNNKAQELQLKDTVFSNPTGLFNKAQYTTAYDLSVMIRYALGNTTFNNIFSSKAKAWFGKTGPNILISQNKLFWSYNGVDGGKVGYNEKDKQTAVTTATRNSSRLIAVVLDSPEDSVYDDSVKLLDYGFNNFITGLLVSKQLPIKKHQVENIEVNLICADNVYYTYPVGKNYIKSLNFKINKEITLPVTKNQVLGTAVYTLIDGTVINVDLYSDTEIHPPETFWSLVSKKLMDNRDILVLIVILLSLELIILLFKLFKFIKNILLQKKK